MFQDGEKRAYITERRPGDMGLESGMLGGEGMPEDFPGKRGVAGI